MLQDTKAEDERFQADVALMAWLEGWALQCGSNVPLDDEAVSAVSGAVARYARYAWLSNPILIVATNGRSALCARTAAEQAGVQIVDRSASSSG